MIYSSLTIAELQNLGNSGDSKALEELGKKVCNIKFCHEETYCSYEIELHDLQRTLENEMPPECPHCGKFVS
jgi:hypothetical protein